LTPIRQDSAAWDFFLLSKLLLRLWDREPTRCTPPVLRPVLLLCCLPLQSRGQCQCGTGLNRTAHCPAHIFLLPKSCIISLLSVVGIYSADESYRSSPSLHSQLARSPHLSSHSPPPGTATPPVCAHAGDVQGTVRPPSLMAVLPARATPHLTPRFTHPSCLRAFVQAGSATGTGGRELGARESGAYESGARAREGLRQRGGGARNEGGAIWAANRGGARGAHQSEGGELVEGHLTYA
jgi:hypothetical protein